MFNSGMYLGRTKHLSRIIHLSRTTHLSRIMHLSRNINLGLGELMNQPPYGAASCAKLIDWLSKWLAVTAHLTSLASHARHMHGEERYSGISLYTCTAIFVT